MKIEVRYPNKYLSEFIKCYWILEKGNTIHKERLFPTGELQMIFHYGTPFTERRKSSEETAQPEFLCCGQFTRYREIISSSSAGLIGVVFYPYSLTSFLNIPASEFSHNTIDLESIDKGYGILGCRIQEAANTVKRIEIIESFLMRNLIVPNINHYEMVKESLKYISSGQAKFNIEKLAKRLCISERQFERVFNKYVGLSPRTFSGIIRFNKALKMIGGPFSLTEISFIMGYYDQSQFIHSFKEFTGFTPGQYREQIIKEKMSE